MADNTDDLLKEALERFKLTVEAEHDQREAELDDLRFVDLEQQWPDDVKAARAGYMGGNGIPPVPPRPCLTINLLKQPVMQVCNQQRQARLAVSFAPKSDDADRETAEAMEDIVRGIQAESRAQLARSWAFTRAAKCGRGYYRILYDYANDGDDDLDIVYKRILNQSSVYFDPFSQEPDFSDARFCFITSDMPLKEFKRTYDKSKLAGMDDEDLAGIGDDAPDWVGGEEGSRTVRIAEYFYVEEQTVPGKKRPQRVVKWCKIDAVEILEQEVWNGRYIPVVPVVGDEYNVNGVRRWAGIVRSAKDSNRSYNYMASAQVEGVGLAPKAPWIMAEGQDEGYEQMWALANVRNFPALKYKPTTLGGELLPPPQRNVVEPAIQAITLAKHEANADVKSTTGIFDASLGNMSPSDRSGKAIMALQKQAEIGTSGYIDNLANMSMMLEGKILRDLIPKVYDRPGRVVPAMGADDQRRSIMVGQPYQDTPEGPQAVPIPPPQPGQKLPPGVKHIDLSRGEYSVAVTTSKAYSTKDEEAVAMMGQLAEAAPQLVPTYADIWVGKMGFPGALQVADRIKKTLPPQLQEEGQGKDIPPQVQQMLQQQGQMLEMMTKELEAKTRIIETDAIKAEQDMAKAKEDNAAKIRIAEIQAQTTIAAAEIKMAMEDFKARVAHIEMIVGHEAEARKIESQQSHEAALTMATQGHDAAMQGQQQQADAAQQGAQQQFEGQQAEANRGHEAMLTGAQLDAQQQMAAQKAAQAAQDEEPSQ